MTEEKYNTFMKKEGFGFIGVLIVIAVIAAMGVGSLYYREVKKRSSPAKNDTQIAEEALDSAPAPAIQSREPLPTKSPPGTPSPLPASKPVSPSTKTPPAPPPATPSPDVSANLDAALTTSAELDAINQSLQSFEEDGGL